MVPVAVNLHLLRHGKYSWQEDAQGRRIELMHYRPGTKQKLSQYQGIWILAPDGEILTTYGNRDPSFHWDPKINEPLVRAFLDRIDAALKEFGDVRPRKVQQTNPLPYRGVAVRQDGSVTLAAYVNGSVLDSFTLSKEQWKTFAPPSTDVGAQWTLSEPVMRSFSRILSPISDLGHHPPRPQDVTDIHFTGKVIGKEDGIVPIAYSGHIAATLSRGPKHASHAKMHFIGIGTYDENDHQIVSLTWISDGTYRGYPPWDKLRETEALLEWRRSN
jgi:hypothetical protein